LYIKYDKKLIVKSDNINIKNNKTNKTYKFLINADISFVNNKYNLSINDFRYKNINLELKSDISLTQKQFDDLLNKKIKNLELKNFSFKFDKKLKAIKTKSTFITYKNNNLYFQLKKPSLDKIKLDKSKLVLKNINKSMVLDLDLYINSTINKKLLNIVKHYGVKLPIVQYKGKNKIYVKAIVPFLKKTKVDIYVKVNSKNAKIKYANIMSETKDLLVQYKNKIVTISAKNGHVNIDNKDIYFSSMDLTYKNNIFNINAKSGKINIFKQNISFDKTKVKYSSGIIDIVSTNGELNFKNKNTKFKNLFLNINKNKIDIKTNISQKDLNISINSKIDTKKETSKGDIFIYNAKYQNLLEYKNKNLSYILDYSNNKINLKIPNENILYTYDGVAKHLIKSSKLDTFLNKIEFLQNKNKNKKTKLIINTIDDFKNIKIYIENLYLNINHERFSKFKFQKDSNQSDSIVNINIKNSILAYDNRKLYVDKSQINIDKKRIDINIMPENEKNDITINIYKKNIKLKAKQVSANLINTLLKSNKLKGGFIDIELVGDARSLNGRIKLKENTVKNVRVLNNLIAFINTTPAYFNPLLALPTLFRLGETGFDMNGYYITKGSFNFIYNKKNKVLKLNSLYTKGKMADFKGKVKINFLSKKINANLDVIFLKDYSKFIDHIPILGYIIVGDDGNFVTKVDVDGSFEKQTFQTYVLNDSITGIFNVIKRTISIPLLPFLKKKKE